MIIDGLLLVFQGCLNVLLLPLTVVNITVDFLSGLTIFTSFLQVIAYILPWGNILPLIILTISIIGFKIAVSILRTVWAVLPFV